MNVFVDTSALVKYFHEEKGTNAVTSLIDNPKNEAFYKEFSTFYVEPISRLIIQESEKLLLQYGNKYNLRTLDAIQMSTFILLLDSDNWLFVGSDDNLIKTVKDWGAKTFNPLDQDK